jgi:uncharacterized protein (DUF849 family)
MMKKIIIAAIVLLGTLLSELWGFALTPQQVINLKKAGVSDQTIQLMIKQEEAAKDPYATMGTKEIKDKDGNTVIIYTTGKNDSSAADEEEAKNVERAWEMLRNLNIKIK